MINDSSMRPFQLEFDFCLEGVSNAWEAHGMLVTDAKLETAEVWSVEYIGDAANGWPTMRITFQCIESAKAYTAIYLGLGPIGGNAWTVYSDDEVLEYISTGTFVGK